MILASKVPKDYDGKRFSAYLFRIRTFWEQYQFEGKIDEKSSQYIYLLDYFVVVGKEFLSKKKVLQYLEPRTIDKLVAGKFFRGN